MIKVTLIALGKLKEKYLADAVKEYEKRLSRYCRLNIIELEPVKLNSNPSDGEIQNALEKEAQMILKRIPDGDDIIPLCVEGKGMTSEKLAERFYENSADGRGMTFIIGSSYGLSEIIKKTGDLRLSLSEMTFPHRIFRVMRLEQIYRAFKINEGSAYHK